MKKKWYLELLFFAIFFLLLAGAGRMDVADASYNKPSRLLAQKLDEIARTRSAFKKRDLQLDLAERIAIIALAYIHSCADIDKINKLYIEIGKMDRRAASTLRTVCRRNGVNHAREVFIRATETAGTRKSIEAMRMLHHMGRGH